MKTPIPNIGASAPSADRSESEESADNELAELPASQAQVSLLLEPWIGVLPMLDDEARAVPGSDEKFLQRVLGQHAGSTLLKAGSAAQAFVCIHSAGEREASWDTPTAGLEHTTTTSTRHGDHTWT